MKTERKLLILINLPPPSYLLLPYLIFRNKYITWKALFVTVKKTTTYCYFYVNREVGRYLLCWYLYKLLKAIWSLNPLCSI